MFSKKKNNIVIVYNGQRTIHAELLQSLDKPETIKKMLLNPNINVSYIFNQSQGARIYKTMTPVFYVFYMIFGFTLFPSPESEKKLNDLLKTARLMVNHHTYKENIKYEFSDSVKENIDNWFAFIPTKNDKIYRKLVNSGFTLKSFANNSELTNSFIEDKYTAPESDNSKKPTEDEKKNINKTLQKVKKY